MEDYFSLMKMVRSIEDLMICLTKLIKIAELKNFLRVEGGLTKTSVTWNPYSSELLSIIYENHYMVFFL